MIDYTRLRKKLNPEPQIGGDPGLILRTATVADIASDGTVDLLLDGVTVPDVSVLSGAAFSIGSIVQVLSYRGSLLVIGASSSLSQQGVSLTGISTSGTTSSTGFTNTLGGGAFPIGGIHGVAFVAPPSGKVYVHGRAVAGAGTAGESAVLDFEVKDGGTVGSGSTFRAPSEATAGLHRSAVIDYQSSVVTGDFVTGLTPGSVYNVALTYHGTTGASSTRYNRRYIAVTPQ